MTTIIPNDLRRAFDIKVRAGIFNPIARYLPDDVREDRLQDAICQTWAMYERHAERGELLDDAILVHSCRLRATDASRHYAPCEGSQRMRDVLDARNFMQEPAPRRPYRCRRPCGTVAPPSCSTGSRGRHARGMPASPSWS